MNLIQVFLDARRHRLAVRELRALSPEMLLDIGIEPHGSIEKVVSEMLAARPPKQAETPCFAAETRSPAAAAG